MSNFLRWFICISFTLYCAGIIWIYKLNTVEEASAAEVIIRGRIRVSASYESSNIAANIFLNDQDTSKVTPALLKVAPRNYLIRLEAKGYKPAEQEVEVKTLKTTEVKIPLEPL